MPVILEIRLSVGLNQIIQQDGIYLLFPLHPNIANSKILFNHLLDYRDMGPMLLSRLWDLSYSAIYQLCRNLKGLNF